MSASEPIVLTSSAPLFDPNSLMSVEASAARQRLADKLLSNDEWSAGLQHSQIAVRPEEIDYGWNQYRLGWDWYQALERSLLNIERAGFALLALTVTIRKLAAEPSFVDGLLTFVTIVALIATYAITLSARWPRRLHGPPTSRGLIAQPDEAYWRRAVLAEVFVATETFYERAKVYSRAANRASVGVAIAGVALALSAIF